MFSPDFYPTPPELAQKMIDGITLSEVGAILEPSAGKGDIVRAIKEKHERWKFARGQKPLDLDAIEVEQPLRDILKGQGIRVIHDDFLTLDTHKRYGLIIMNPPFSSGDKHLLKALDMQQRGGKIVCLLNAETLRNPYTNTRRDLVRRLEEYEAKIEFLGSVFIGAERSTDVEVALVKVDIPRAESKSIILDGLRRREQYIDQNRNPQAVTHAEFVDRIVAQYNFEIKAGLTLIREYAAMQPIIQRSFKEDDVPIIKLNVEGEAADSVENSYVQTVRSKYWHTLFLSEEFSSLLTSKLREDYIEKIQDLKHYDFSVFNIRQIQEEISRNMSKGVEEVILALFDELSNKYHWIDSTSKNIHYYNGWKTNKAWVINKRVIMPCMDAWGWGSWNNKPYYSYKILEKLSDIEKVFDYLDGGRSDHVDLQKSLQLAQNAGDTKKIPLKYFNVSFYKKGTCHIEFTNLELLKKFNLFGSQRKGWLPPGYGQVQYEDMSAEEQAVIDSFEGPEEYARVCRDKGYYLVRPITLLPAPGVKAS